MSTSAAAFREEAEQRQKEMEGESSRDLEQHILSWVISQCFPHSSDSPSKTLSGFLQESCLFVAPRALSSHLEALDGHMKTLETFALFPHLPHLHPDRGLGQDGHGLRPPLPEFDIDGRSLQKLEVFHPVPSTLFSGEVM